MDNGQTIAIKIIRNNTDDEVANRHVLEECKTGLILTKFDLN